MESAYKSRSVIDTADAVRRGELRAVDVLEQCPGTLEDLNPAINAFVMLRVGAAREEAEAIDRMVARGEDPGPLAGVPIGIKDIEDIAGLPTTQGSLLLAGAPPADRDCPHVEKLRAVWSDDLGYAVVEPEVLALARAAADRLIAAARLTRLDCCFHPINARDALGVVQITRARDELYLAGTLPARYADLGDQFQHFPELMKDVGPAEITAAWGVIRRLEREVADFSAPE